jgi:hypothetical protein
VLRNPLLRQAPNRYSQCHQTYKNIMKKHILILSIFCGFLFSTLEVKAQEKNFSYREGNKYVKLEFEDGLTYLEVNKPTKFKVTLENIDLKSSDIYGCGITLLGKGRGKNYYTCNINVVEACIKSKNELEISIRYDIKGKRKLFHKFLIPIKN